MKNYLIKKTERESLIYGIFQELKYLFGKLVNLKNYIIRKHRINKFYSENKIKKIQFGAGSGKLSEAGKANLEGFLDTDIFGDVPVDINFKLPFKNNSIDLIFNSHLIEHIYQRKMKSFLLESFRVLKVNSYLITATPSLEKISKILYGKDQKKIRLIYKDHENSLMGKKPTPARIINSLTHINYGHKFLLDYLTFKDLATNAGFSTIKKIEINDMSDQTIKSYLKQKSDVYKIQTEIFIAKK